MRRFGAPTPARVLDLGCGTGRDAGYLAEQGHQVVGLDASEEMLDYARRHHPRVTFLPGRLESFALEQPFDLITCLDSALLYCHHNEELAAALAACRNHLAPGGLLLAEQRNGAYFLGSGPPASPTERSVQWRGVTYHAHTELWIDHAAQLLRRRRRWSWDGQDPIGQESAWRLLFPQELRALVAAAGLTVLALFDTPGPRTRPGWRDDAPLGTTLRGDRLHLVAQRPRAA
ncbi:class I SAM-dependent methyltransferase [Natronosporangium hydrolyticum]|uniref:Class I SAM-dependent methyltransferase n=2 Tax=Natronosporangium hydrolyticum TaxID=2811111 RepID=A0A895YNP3_9ACTN|nr:class I SAM-dependent methyltransferase [Natronosporangium hydrolyticum]